MIYCNFIAMSLITRDLLPRGTQTISKSTWIDSLHFLSVVSGPKKVPELYEHEYEFVYYISCIEF